MSKYRKTIDESNLTLTIERSFGASKDRVWDYFTKRDLIEQWWGPEQYPTTIKAFDFKVGGIWHYYMTGPDGTKYWGLAEYTAIDDKRSIDYDDYFSDESGERSTSLPASLVHIKFSVEGTATRITTTLRFTSLEDLQKLVEMGFEEGFASQCDKLDKLLLDGKETSPTITVETTVNAPVSDVWHAYTTPADIIQWNAASDDWHTPHASVDLRNGGAFSSRMEAKDGSMGFDFAGTYTQVVEHKLIEYFFGDRSARVEFAPSAEGVTVRVNFEAETTHSIEEQRGGWQAILDNFKRHVEAAT